MMMMMMMMTMIMMTTSTEGKFSLSRVERAVIRGLSCCYLPALEMSGVVVPTDEGPRMIK